MGGLLKYRVQTIWIIETNELKLQGNPLNIIKILTNGQRPLCAHAKCMLSSCIQLLVAKNLLLYSLARVPNSFFICGEYSVADTAIRRNGERDKES